MSACRRGEDKKVDFRVNGFDGIQVMLDEREGIVKVP